MNRYIYGIDFGTTNSALAILDLETNEIVKIFTTPSLLFFPEVSHAQPSYYVGKEAIEGYVNAKMKGRFMKSIKRVLPNKSFKNTKIYNQIFAAEDLVALIISHLKKLADDFLGENIQTAVIGRPVIFDENAEKDALAQERLSKAIKLAGITTFYFQMEPIGAAFAYERQLKAEELVLVADFGGGTSDFTLMKLSPKAIYNANRQADMIAKGGVYIGGDNFDSSIMWESGTPYFGRGLEYESRPGKWLPLPITFFLNICTWEKINFFDSNKIKSEVKSYFNLSGKKPALGNLMKLIEYNLGYKIFKEIEKTKIELSSHDSSSFSFHQEGIDFDHTITFNEFENSIIKSDLDKIDKYLSDFLTRLGIDNSQINSVFMTGGTSLVKALNNRFVQRFGIEKIKSGDNFNSVAIGLAYSYTLFRE